MGFTRVGEITQKRLKNINSQRKNLPALQVGDTVYYRRPEGSGKKLDTHWIGPALITGRKGELSITIQIKDNSEIKSHRSFLKLCESKSFLVKAIPLFYHKRTQVDTGAIGEEWEVEEILKHRVLANGVSEFQTKWVGFGVEDATWEPVERFMKNYDKKFVEYCKSKGINVNLTKNLMRQKEKQPVKSVTINPRLTSGVLNKEVIYAKLFK